MRKLILLATAAMLLALSGCTASPGQPEILRSGSQIIAVSSDNNDGADAEIRGKLALTPSGCWGLESGDKTVSAVIWPLGTTIDDSELLLPGASSPLRLGHDIVGSGGELPDGQQSQLEAECGSDAAIIQMWEVTN